MNLKKSIFTIIIVLLFVRSIICIAPQKNNYSEAMQYNDVNSSLKTSSTTNGEIIQEVFSAKNSQFQSEGYYTQMFDSSLQATYYGLYVLDTIGKLGDINTTEVLTHIMSFYDPDSKLFMDNYSYRYLDTDFSQVYYPLSTQLEVNCYAVLSLDLLDSLNLIDTSEMISYLWECYNTDTSGFIGQKYDTSLEEGFKISTMDNTYFAVYALDLLMDDWSQHGTERDEIVQFINDLQISQGSGWMVGGFLNDMNSSLDSINPLFEPNLLSSYYCIKTLKLFGMEDSINKPNFHSFLDTLYDSTNYYFRISQMDYGIEYANIVATALGLELSDITSYPNINRENVITFLLNNRNSWGIWDSSTLLDHHELIDTFQIVRVLNNTEEISRLNEGDKSQISGAVSKYYSYNGFAPLSEDYMTMDLIHSIVSSYKLYDKLSDLDISQLYSDITSSYNPFGSCRFVEYITKGKSFTGLRSRPYEFYTTGYKNYVDEINVLISHKATFHALTSLREIFKLDDFSLSYDLHDLLDDIIASQFLNDSYYNSFGGFTYWEPYNPIFSEFLSKNVYFFYTYYAVRNMELLGNYLGLGDLTQLSFDIDALYCFIDRKIVESATYVYLDPGYTSNVEDILEQTYYMIYILKALDLYNKNTQKTKNYVLDHLDYSNIKNIYYSYKISEILDLNIEFNSIPIQNLMKAIYSEDLYEFYLTSAHQVIDHDILYWICDLAKNSEVIINIEYPEVVSLGEFIPFTANVQNLIIDDFGSYITLKCIHEKLGTILFDKLEGNEFTKDVYVPIEKDYYPEIALRLEAYEGFRKLSEQNITVYTDYSITHHLTTEVINSSVYLEINGTYKTSLKEYNTSYGQAYSLVYGESFLEEKFFYRHDFENYSLFSMSYDVNFKFRYTFEIYLSDGINNEWICLGNYTFYKGEIKPDDEVPDDPFDGHNPNYEDELLQTIPVITILTLIPGSVIVLTTVRTKKLKKR